SIVAQADNGIEAVDLAVELAPDLVAMDIEMSLMDGIEATREIMARAPTRIVVLSAGEDGPDLGRGAEAIRAGAVTVVPKPAGPGAFSELRREIFLEMVRAATRKDIKITPGDFENLQGTTLRPTQSFASPSFQVRESEIDFE